jgi:ubiquinone/menaquinone biosynthesis C-methylase UbiE
MSAPDWGQGRYEPTAHELVPAAGQLVSMANLRGGEQVLDLGCGTGTVALLAARAGAQVVGVDPAHRLLEVARAAAADAGLAIDFRAGGAPGIPADDASQDAVLSNFALIFTHDPTAAVADVARVLRPGGRVLFDAWVPGGTIDKMITAAMQALADAVGHPVRQPGQVSWHDPRVVETLFAATDRHFEVRTETHQIVFRAASPQAYLDEVQLAHPMAVMTFEMIRRAGGDPDRARTAMLQALVAGNEDPAAFQATSKYVVHVVR